MLNEEVRRIMTENPITANADDSLSTVTEIMKTNKLQQLPVVDGKKLVGMVTSFDLWKASEQADKPRHVKEIMTTKVIKIAPKDKVGTAAELFMDKRFKTLPVVNLDGDLKGVITAFDVIRHTLKKEYPKSILYKEVIEG
jgi:CBS domain-containing protein